MFSILLAVSLAATAAPAAEPAPAAKAADPAKAKELFNAGKKLYDARNYKDAVLKFEEAYAARPHPVILFNIAKCYELIGESGKGETGKSLRAYRDYLRASPEATDKAEVGDSIANLERKLKDRGLQQVLIFAEPKPATILIDNKDIGLSPASAELSPGEHKLVARAEGFNPVERSFTMSSVRSQEVTINLTPTGSTPPVPDAPRKDDGLKQPSNASISPSSTTPPASNTPPESIVAKKAAPTKSGGRLFTWVAAGGAVVAGGVGAGLGVMAGGANSSLHGAQHTRAEADALVGTASSMSLGANVAYGVAGAAAVTAVVMFFVEGR